MFKASIVWLWIDIAGAIAAVLLKNYIALMFFVLAGLANWYWMDTPREGD